MNNSCARPLALLLAGLAGACGRSEAPASTPETPAAPEQPSIQAELQRIGEELYGGECQQYGRALRERSERELQRTDLTRGERMDRLETLAFEYVESGDPLAGIKTYEEALELAQQGDNPRRERRLKRFLAQAWLRQAENANCLERHNAECCILPARSGAVHQVREPAEKARALYQELLEDSGDALAVRWLVNVTTLLLGESIESLPANQRLPLDTFGSYEGEPLFRDVAKTAGVDTRNLAGGVALEDFDGDGWIDILTSTCDPLGPLKYFRNSGDGTFEDRSGPAGTGAELGGLNLISGDYDEDGDQDAFVLRGAWLLDYGRIPNSLLRNDGGQHFENVTREAGLAEPAYPTQAGTFGDFDGDGSLDLYIGNESRLEIDETGKSDYPSQLFLNDGAGHYTDHATEAGVENDRYTKGVCAGDYDQDGDLDLYASNIGLNRLYRNDGHARFEDVASGAGVTRPSTRSFACWFFDWNQDGWLDLWVSGYQGTIAELAADALGHLEKAERSCLYRNRGDGRFEDVAGLVGLDHPYLAMGANYGDIDNDGWLDLYLGTGDPLVESLMPNALLRNDGGKRFVEVTAQYGAGHLQKGHGIGFADFDHDGDQDVFHQLGGFVPVDTFPNVLFENLTPPGNHWLKLSLEGTRTNRDAFGARVELHLATDEGSRVLYRSVGCVSSFGGSPHRLEIGLGDARRLTRLVVHWPGAQEPQVFEGLPMDAWLSIREGEARVECRELHSFRFQSPPG